MPLLRSLPVPGPPVESRAHDQAHRRVRSCGLLLPLLAGLGLAGCDAPSSDPSAADAGPQAREALATVDPLDRLIRWSDLLGRAGAEALPALRDAVAAGPLDVGDPEVVAFAMWWAHFDPKAALQWTGTEWRAQSRLVVASVFRIWAHREPDLAFASIQGIPEFHRDAAIDAVIVGWYESGKPGLVEKVQSLTDDAYRQRVSESLARRLALALGAEGAIRWLDSVEESAFRQAMTMRVASAASEQGDAAAIAKWVTPRVTSGDEPPSGFPRRIGTRWILRDPEAALAWLASLPAGADRDDGVMESFRDWLRFAPGAALAWIQGAELEPWSEPAFSIYARQLGKQSPEEALELASRFSDETLRNRIITVIAMQWAARDPDAARAWLATADVPAEVRARALQHVQATR